MNSKKYIIFISILFLLFFVFLSVRELHYQNYLTGGQNWFLYFNESKSNDLAFTVENYSKHKNFGWALYLDKDKIQEGSIEIPAGSQETVSPDINLPDIGGKKITVKVTTDNNDERDIYKLLTEN